MAKKPVKQSTAEKFVDKYLEKYKVTPTMRTVLANFLLRIIRDGMTDPERINKYMICNDFYILLAENKYNHTCTYMQLSEEYNYSETQIKNIVYKWRPKFNAINELAEEVL